MQENYDPEYFSKELLPCFEKLDQALVVTNTNLVLFQVLARLNQSIPFEFDMLLKPDKYVTEWRQIFCVLIEFHRTKQEYMDKHLELERDMENSQS